MLFFGDERVREAYLLPVLDTTTLSIFEVEGDLELGLDSALAVLGGNAGDLDLETMVS